VTWLPVVPPMLVLLTAVIGLVAVWWPSPEDRGARLDARTARRTALILLVAGAALRPGLSSADNVRTDSAALDVFFVVDVSGSSMAEDHGGGTRLEGMRADVVALSARMPGAHVALITFAQTATLRLPLTPDAAALESAMATLRAEPTAWSRGSDVAAAGALLRAALLTEARVHPDRPRVVFYLGDGEQTVDRPAAALGVDARLVAGGAVLGYGTTTGGTMQISGPVAATSGPTASTGRILDPRSGQPALSRIDERQLTTIADELGVRFLRAAPGRKIEDVLQRVDLTRIDEVVDAHGAAVGVRSELYWVLLLLAGLLLAWEAGQAGSDLAATRLTHAAGRRPREGGP